MRNDLKIVTYHPEWFDALRHGMQTITPRAGLFHRPFVDYYYASRDWCRLFLAVDRNDRVVGTIGVDRLRFEAESGEMTIGFGSNYYSLIPGAGAFLFMRRMQECPVGIVFPGGEETHKVVASLGWTYFTGIRTYYLNRAYRARTGEPLWRRAAKSTLRTVKMKKLRRYAPRLRDAFQAGISVQSERSFSTDMLPRTSPFTFRFAPSLDYLNWRYNTELPFVRYRLFRIKAGNSTAGYVVINDKPDCMIVAQCDGEDPEVVAYGVMCSVIEAGRRDRYRREVMLTSSHSRMEALYRSFGFQVAKSDPKFALGGYHRGFSIDSDTSTWNVNFDWGDNGLCAPFLDSTGAGKEHVR